MAQWVKDQALSLQQLGLLLWPGFDPWPRNFWMPWAWPKKKKKSKNWKPEENCGIEAEEKKDYKNGMMGGSTVSLLQNCVCWPW